MGRGTRPTLPSRPRARRPSSWANRAFPPPQRLDHRLVIVTIPDLFHGAILPITPISAPSGHHDSPLLWWFPVLPTQCMHCSISQPLPWPTDDRRFALRMVELLCGGRSLDRSQRRRRVSRFARAAVWPSSEPISWRLRLEREEVERARFHSLRARRASWGRSRPALRRCDERRPLETVSSEFLQPPKGANWIRPGSLKCKWRAVVGQQATLKADQIH